MVPARTRHDAAAPCAKTLQNGTVAGLATIAVNVDRRVLSRNSAIGCLHVMLITFVLSPAR